MSINLCYKELGKIKVRKTIGQTKNGTEHVKKAPLLCWFIAWTATIVLFSLSFPVFNLICSGQVNAHKQRTHQRFMMQRHSLSLHIIHNFWRAMNWRWVIRTTLLLWDFPKLKKVALCSVEWRVGRTDEMSMGCVWWCDSKDKCQCIYRTHTLPHNILTPMYLFIF